MVLVDTHWNISDCQNFKEFYKKKINLQNLNLEKQVQRVENLFKQKKKMIKSEEEIDLINEELIIDENSDIKYDMSQISKSIISNQKSTSIMSTSFNRMESLGNSMISQNSGFTTNKKNMSQSPIQDLLNSNNSRRNILEKSKQNKENVNPYKHEQTCGKRETLEQVRN